MSSPTSALEALARSKRRRSVADAVLLVAVLTFGIVYAYLGDSLALRHAGAPAEPAKASAAEVQEAALPQAEEGTPVLDGNAVAASEPDPAPHNDLQRRIAGMGDRLGDTVCGRNIGDAVYVSLTEASRMVGADQRWDKGKQAGVLISDSGLVRLAADSSRASVNEAPRQLSGPVRLVNGEPFIPVRALAELYDASTTQDAGTGLTTITLGAKTLQVAVPERLFKIEICRGERWLKVFYAGKLAKEYPICSGAGDNTPVGHFHIQNKAVWPSWRAYWGELIPGGSPRNPLGARWLGTTARGRVTGWAIGIHGTNQPSSIGRRISGGCIRTYNENSMELYDTIPIGTPVWIHE
ncbi:MAG: hypothetical protein FJX75_18435 [Armatimonadetes bacterium]|nr:hypothetical protein [Armatimonadota bacterium]